jgi:hypothetical protein
MALHLIDIDTIEKEKGQKPVLDYLLKEHFITPKLIPINYEEKISFVNTLSEKLKQHISEKRGIKLS